MVGGNQFPLEQLSPEEGRDERNGDVLTIKINQQINENPEVLVDDEGIHIPEYRYSPGGNRGTVYKTVITKKAFVEAFRRYMDDIEAIREEYMNRGKEQ